MPTGTKPKVTSQAQSGEETVTLIHSHGHWKIPSAAWSLLHWRLHPASLLLLAKSILAVLSALHHYLSIQGLIWGIYLEEYKSHVHILNKESWEHECLGTSIVEGGMGLQRGLNSQNIERDFRYWYIQNNNTWPLHWVLDLQALTNWQEKRGTQMTTVCKICHQSDVDRVSLVGRSRRSVPAGDNRTDSKNGLHCYWVLKSGRIGIDNNGEWVR